jgi:hypothetical protein
LRAGKVPGAISPGSIPRDSYSSGLIKRKESSCQKASGCRGWVKVQVIFYSFFENISIGFDYLFWGEVRVFIPNP